MRNLLIIGMLVGGAFMAGWFKINRDGDHTTIDINRAEIRSDARSAINRGRKILDEREQRAADQQQQRSADDRYADRNGAYPQQQTGYQDGPYQETGYRNPQGYQDGPRDAPRDAPWNQNYGRPAATPYDAPTYNQPRR